jgi:hypothetical protein
MGGGTASVRWLTVISGIAPLAEPAFAGAWTQKAGEQQEIATISRETGDFGEAWRADDNMEAGFGGGWGANLKVAGEVRIGDTFDDRTAVGVGVQKSFALGNRASFSVIGSWLGGEALDGPECTSNGYEARTALGTSYAVAGREAFVNVEAAWRARGENCERGLVEAAAGIEIAPRWNLLVKAWHEEGDDALSSKAEVSMSHDFGGFAVGAGWREEISGSFEEKGWVVTARGRF